MIDAKEARQRSEAVRSARYKAQEDAIQEKIDDAICKGLFEIEYDRIEPPLKKILEEKGYTVRIVNRKGKVGGDTYFLISF
jgi:hypothetical protein